MLDFDERHIPYRLWSLSTLRSRTLGYEAAQLLRSCPAPGGRQGRVTVDIGRWRGVVSSPPVSGRLLAFLLELVGLPFLPLPAALGEDALEKFRGGFSMRMLFPPFGRERPFDRSFEDGGAIEDEFRLDARQCRYSRVEIRQQLVEGIGDTALLITRGQRDTK